MAATEYYFIPYKMAVIKYDPAIIKADTFIDVTIGRLTRVFYKRISDGKLICEVDALTGSVWFYEGNWPPQDRVNLVKGITQLEII